MQIHLPLPRARQVSGLPLLLSFFFIFCLLNPDANAQEKRKMSPVKPKGKKVKVLSANPAEPPPVEEPGDCTGPAIETSGLLGWKWNEFERTPPATNKVFRYWLGPDKNHIDNFYAGINTSNPLSVFEVHFPSNYKSNPEKGLTVTTGKCAKVGLVAGDDYPSWVGAYDVSGETLPPFQVRAGQFPTENFWDPAAGTFIHLDPVGEFIGIKTNTPNFPLDVKGDVHTSANALVDNVLSAAGASIGYGNSTSTPTNGLVVNGNVGIGTGTASLAEKLEVNGKIKADHLKLTGISDGLLTLNNGTVANATATDVNALTGITGEEDYIPKFGANNGLSNSYIRQGGSSYIGFATSPGFELKDHLHFGDWQTVHADGGSSHFSFNSYSQLSGTTWTRPRLHSVASPAINYGASEFWQYQDGSMGFNNLKGTESDVDGWKTVLVMTADRNVGIGTSTLLQT